VICWIWPFLIGPCMIQSVDCSAWSLPLSAIPIYAVLVILLAIPEASTRKWNESRAELSAWQRATFAMALFGPGWNDLQASGRSPAGISLRLMAGRKVMRRHNGL